jgi:hypothetical protein
MAVLIHPFAHDRPDDRVQAGAIPSAGQDPDPRHLDIPS